MPFLPGLAVIFAGLLGGGDGKVGAQLDRLVQRAGARTQRLPAEKLEALTHHREGFREIVRALHADGVIACEVVTGHGTPTLRVVIYDGDGNLKTYTETSLASGALAVDELVVVRDNIAADVAALASEPAEPDPAPAPSSEAEALLDAGPKPDASPPAESDASDAVSIAEIEAMTGSDEGPPAKEPETRSSSLKLGATAGVGIAGRSFTPGPVTVPGYNAGGVAAFRLEAHVRPTAKSKLAVSAERTFAMTTPMGAETEAASTSIGRWEAHASRAIIDGAFELAATGGIGRRTFAIESDDPSRSPDSSYNYLLVGATGAIAVGRIVVRANLAFEPVISGTEPTEMAFGEARRWGVDIGAAVDLAIASHLALRAAADYQRFTWLWDDAGARGAGGAVDVYPSGSLSLSAEY